MDIEDFLKFFLIVLVCTAIFFGAIFTFVLPIDMYMCNSKQDVYGLPTIYRGGVCYIDDNGRVIKMEAYETMQVNLYRSVIK